MRGFILLSTIFVLSSCVVEAPPAEPVGSGERVLGEPGFGELLPSEASNVLSAVMGVARTSLEHYLETTATRTPDLQSIARGEQSPPVDADVPVTLTDCVRIEKTVDEAQGDLSFTADYTECSNGRSGTTTVRHALSIDEDATVLTEEHALVATSHRSGDLSWSGESTWVRFDTFEEELEVFFHDTVTATVEFPSLANPFVPFRSSLEHQLHLEVRQDGLSVVAEGDLIVGDLSGDFSLEGSWSPLACDRGGWSTGRLALELGGRSASLELSCETLSAGVEDLDAERVAELIARRLQPQDCSDCDLTGADLRFVDLTRTDLDDADLTGATLTGAYLTHADLDDATFADAELSRALVARSSAEDSVFDGAVLDGTVFLRSDLESVSMRMTDLRSTTLRRSTLESGDFGGSNLAGKSLRGNLEDASFVGAVLRDMDLRGAFLQDGSLERADLTGADLTDADLQGVRWSDTTCPDGSNSDDAPCPRTP